MLVALLAALLTQGQSPPIAKVSGLVTHVSRICGGGAAVSREELARLPPPAPLAGKTLRVRRGRKISRGPAFAKVTTGASGRFNVELPHGVWCFFAAERALGPAPQNVAAVPMKSGEAECLAELRTSCDLVLEVAGDVRHADVSFYEACPQVWNQPCYRGPSPP